MTQIEKAGAGAGMLEVDGDSIGRLNAAELPALLQFAEAIPPEIFKVPSSPGELARLFEDLGKKPWSMPMVCHRNGKAVGLCLMSVGQLKNLNAYLVAVFSDPVNADRLLALYMRQAFWTYPLHRLYSQLPAVPSARSHVDLMLRVGFQREGTLEGHIDLDRDRHVDADVLGILRGEFDQWCRINQPQLWLP